MHQDASDERQIYSVSLLNLEAQRVLEGGFPLIWLEGEISNLSRPASGHLYLSLKDERAQISAAMFRGRNKLLSFSPRNGLQVLVRARVTLYVPRGNFQLVIEHMEEAGEGALRRQLEALKAALQAEGLFAVERKRPLPTMPQQIGVITSASGAALRDVLKVLQRRCPGIPVLVYPSAVQGKDAPAQLIAALETANRRNECDVLLLTRGGGSLEDLWAFNNENLARAVASSRLPIVSAVGHEIDESLTDLVADLRAPTPSAAAEILSPDLQGLQQRLTQADQRLKRSMLRLLQDYRQQVGQLARQLARPDQRLQQYAQQLDELEARMKRQLSSMLQLKRQQLQQLQRRLQAQTPAQQLALFQHQLDALQRRLAAPLPILLRHRQRELEQLGQRLQAISPLAVLDRGYSLTLKDNQPLRSIKGLTKGDTLETRLAKGRITSVITSLQGDKQ